MTSTVITLRESKEAGMQVQELAVKGALEAVQELNLEYGYHGAALMNDRVPLSNSPALCLHMCLAYLNILCCPHWAQGRRTLVLGLTLGCHHLSNDLCGISCLCSHGRDTVYNRQPCCGLGGSEPELLPRMHGYGTHMGIWWLAWEFGNILSHSSPILY